MLRGNQFLFINLQLFHFGIRRQWSEKFMLNAFFSNKVFYANIEFVYNA